MLCGIKPSGHMLCAKYPLAGTSHSVTFLAFQLLFIIKRVGDEQITETSPVFFSFILWCGFGELLVRLRDRSVGVSVKLVLMLAGVDVHGSPNYLGFKSEIIVTKSDKII